MLNSYVLQREVFFHIRQLQSLHRSVSLPISVTLKTEIQQRIDDTVIAILHLKTNTPQRTIKKWLQEASSKLTHYSFLIALSEIFSTPIENLIDIHRQ